MREERHDSSTNRGKEKEKDRKKRRSDHDRDHDRERNREKDRQREKDRGREKEKEKEKERERAREKGREKHKEKSSREAEQDHKERSRERGSKRAVNEEEVEDRRVEDRGAKQDGDNGSANVAPPPTTAELEERLLKMKEERTKKKSEDSSDVLSWVSKIRKIEAEKEKALLKSRLLEEQDNIEEEEESDKEEEPAKPDHLAGVKVLHGIDKVMEGGAIVLTLKDQYILADGDINEDVDMLENVEIGEQKQRDDAYKAAKKKTGTYDDKFNDDPSEKRMLPQYDDPNADEGITLDAGGRFTGEAEKRLEELRKRLSGASSYNRTENLNLPVKISSDYLTPEEVLKFKKPKKKRALRKKEKLDIDALEAEAIYAGLGVGDLGSRRNAKNETAREEQDRTEAERRDKAYKNAYAKAEEASKSLRPEQPLPIKREEDEDEDVVFADDAEDLYKSLERARKIALKKKVEEETLYGPDSVARLAATIASNNQTAEQAPESQGIVFTEMEEFVQSLQIGQDAQKHDSEDVFMDEDEDPKVSDGEEVKDEPSGWTEVKDEEMEENPTKEQEEEIAPVGIIHEAPVGKGLSGVLKLLQERGTLKETVDWGGRNMDKKKSKLVGIFDDDEPKTPQQSRHKKDSKDFVYEEKDIRIERLDEFGRILTPKEAFRTLSHKFHGKGPGKMKQEKRMKQFEEELKLKQMKSSDTPSMSVERMRETQAQLKTPYIVLSGHVKSGQAGDPNSGYGTVEKGLSGDLTPMLGDKKVEHFLGIKRKPGPSNLGPSNKTNKA